DRGSAFPDLTGHRYPKGSSQVDFSHLPRYSFGVDTFPRRTTGDDLNQAIPLACRFGTCGQLIDRAPSLNILRALVIHRIEQFAELVFRVSDFPHRCLLHKSPRWFIPSHLAFTFHPSEVSL